MSGSDQYENAPFDPQYMSAEDMYTDRQLSSDLENILRIGQQPDVQVKEESASACGYGTMLGASCAGDGVLQGMYVLGTTEYASLPSGDLEVDNASMQVPTMMPTLQHQVKEIPVPRSNLVYMQLSDFTQQQLNSGEIEKQIRLDEEGRCISENSMIKHEQWRQWQQQHPQQQQQQQPPQQAQAQQPIEEVLVVTTEAGNFERELVVGGYTVQLDEIGEGPLHLLSVITDEAALLRNLEVIEVCGVIPYLINLQNKYKQTPLFLAVQEHNLTLAAWLLKHGADPNIQGTLYIDRDDYIWRGPLHLAVMKGDMALPMVQLLLTSSPSIDINLLTHGDKQTALHLSLRAHNIVNENFTCRQIILLLVDHHTDIDIRDPSSSKTPCMMVVETRDLPLIQEFLEKFPANKRRQMLQDQTRAGDTCLHLAAGLSRIQSIQKIILLRLLVTNGANGNIANNVKELPKDFARFEWNQLRKT